MEYTASISLSLAHPATRGIAALTGGEPLILLDLSFLLDRYPPLADNRENVELIETSAFTKQITDLLSDEEYGEFQSRLAANPQLGALIRGGGGMRKIRVAVGTRGKRGGARVIYYWAMRRDLILLLYAYPKNVTADLTPKQVSQLARVVKEEFGDES